MDHLTSSAPAPIDAVAAVNCKVDLFFRTHVIPCFDPDRIHWWFSLSGGKDSFTMREAVGCWYKRNGAKFNESVFTIDQWGGPAPRNLQTQFGRERIQVVDARSRTVARTMYVSGQQAPCRRCSDVRREVTDELLRGSAEREGRIHFVARGLHLSDTAISFLWRHALGRDAYTEVRSGCKYQPIAKLPSGAYLAKPLGYIREFESARYADAVGFGATCCGCPACRFPSRRDIVEESIADFFQGGLWELDIPGVERFVGQMANADIRGLSYSGRLERHRHIPEEFYEFVVEKFRRIAARSSVHWSKQCDSSRDLDSVGAARLAVGSSLLACERPPLPALISGRTLSQLERRMIATMGPFWGALGLTAESAMVADSIQQREFGLRIDDKWAQVNVLLTEYYGAVRRGTAEEVVLGIPKNRESRSLKGRK